jgi:hypothetical protein
MQPKLVSSPIIHAEIPKLSFNEELPKKSPNMDAENFGKSHCNHVS